MQKSLVAIVTDQVINNWSSNDIKTRSMTSIIKQKAESLSYNHKQNQEYNEQLFWK